MQDSEAVSKALQELETANNTKRIEDIEYVISELQKVNSTMDDFTKNVEWQKTKELLADFDARYHTQALTNCDNLAAFTSTIKDNLNKGKFVDAMKEVFGKTLGNYVFTIWQQEHGDAQKRVDLYAEEYALAFATVAGLSPSSFGYEEAKNQYNAILRTYQYELQEKSKYEKLTPEEEDILKQPPLSDTTENYYLVDGKLMKISGNQVNLLNASGDKLDKVLVYKYDAITDSDKKGHPLKDIVEGAGKNWDDYVSQFQQAEDEAAFLATTPGLSQYDIIQNRQNRDGHYSIIIENTLIGTQILGDPNNTERFWEHKDMSFDTKSKKPIYISKLDYDINRVSLQQNPQYRVYPYGGGDPASGELLCVEKTSQKQRDPGMPPDPNEGPWWYFDGGPGNDYKLENINTCGYYINISNEKYYIMYTGELEIGDKVEFEYLPNSKIILSINNPLHTVWIF